LRTSQGHGQLSAASRYPRKQHLAPFYGCSGSTMKVFRCPGVTWIFGVLVDRRRLFCQIITPGGGGRRSSSSLGQTLPCLASNVPPRTPVHHEERSLPPVEAFEVHPKNGYKGSCDQSKATGSQVPPSGTQKTAFGIVLWLFGVNHEGVLVPWGHLDVRGFGRPEVVLGREFRHNSPTQRCQGYPFLSLL
jgi:hypothetical protein